MTLYSAVNLEGKKNNQKSRIFVFVVPTRGTSYLESQWRDYYNHGKMCSFKVHFITSISSKCLVKDHLSTKCNLLLFCISKGSQQVCKW